MKKIYVLITLTMWAYLAYSQGTQVGDSTSPIYHYNGNVGVGLTNPSGRLHILHNSTIGTPANFNSAYLKISNPSNFSNRSEPNIF